MNEPKKQLGNYEITAEIGRGGYATVFHARHSKLKKVVALKLLSPIWLNEEAVRARFIREAQTAAALSHPGIVQIDDLFVEDDHVYIVMEYMAGGDLRKWVADHPRATWREHLELLRPVAEALDYAHTLRIWHRDVKPSNILIDERGRARLGDFGLVHVEGVRGPHLTTLGSVVGTASYMAPEQAEGKQVDGRADQYALAVVLFELLTGRVPFQGETTTSILLGHVNKPPPAASDINPALPATVNDVLHQGLAKQPDERFPDCSTLLKALQTAFVAGERAALQALLAEAETLLQAGNLEQVRLCLENARHLLPAVPELHAELARIDQVRQNAEQYSRCHQEWQAACRHAREVDKLDPAFPDRAGILVTCRVRPPVRNIAALLREGLISAGVGLAIGLPLIALFYQFAFWWVVRP